MYGFLARVEGGMPRILTLQKRYQLRSPILRLAKRRAIPDALRVCAEPRSTDGSIRGGGARTIILRKRRILPCRG